MMTIGAPLLGAFMSRGQQPQPQPQPVRVNPVQPQALPTPEQMAQAKAQDLLGKLRFVTPVLVRAAKKGSFIDSYVDILNDNLDDEGHEMLVFMLQRDDWISTLFNDNPDVVANRQWFENLREAILNPDEDAPGEETAQASEEPKAPHPFS
jgi:disulfide oxidoreductase YuzD